MTDIRQKALSAWFSQQLQIDNVTLDTVSADASFRRYFRYSSADTSYILVDAPTVTEKNKEFVEFSTKYAEQGIDVPRVLFADFVQGFLCLTDLGDQLLLPLLRESDLSWYQLALKQLDLVARVQQPSQAGRYDREFFNLELGLFSQWFCDKLLNLSPELIVNDDINHCFELLIDNALEQPQVSVHRDFHSRNIMVRDLASLALIDYQDTIIGPLTYDLASLLKDCYFRVPQDERDKLLQQAFLQFTVSQQLTCEFSQFKQWFDLMGLQRHLKVCGIFSRLSLRDNKHHYLDDLPLVLHYIIETCHHYPQMKPLENLFMQHITPALSQRGISCTQ